jgi:hypothetical protein
MSVPTAQVPVRLTELPEQLLGAFNAVGAAGMGVTVTVFVAVVLLQAVLAVLVQFT